MFGKSDHRRKGSPLSQVFRLFLSLIIMGVLFVGLLQAYRAFSGVNVLEFNPKSIAKGLLTSDSAYKVITGLLSVNPKDSLKSAKDLLSNGTPAGSSGDNKPKGEVKFAFAVVADSHVDTQNLNKALAQAKSEGARFVVGMGDFSNVGTVDELRNSKVQFDSQTLPFYTTPGDHDLWDSRNKSEPSGQNFISIFGTPYQSFSYDNARLLIIYNSDNYTGVDSFQIKWIEDELDRIKANPPKLFFVFADTPLYHPSSDHIMGKTTPKLKDQADHLVNIFQKAGVDQVFSADTHSFAQYVEPKTGLKMTTVGAATSERNPQNPKFVMVDVYTDGSYNIREVEIK